MASVCRREECLRNFGKFTSLHGVTSHDKILLTLTATTTSNVAINLPRIVHSCTVWAECVLPSVLSEKC